MKHFDKQLRRHYKRLAEFLRWMFFYHFFFFWVGEEILPAIPKVSGLELYIVQLSFFTKVQPFMYLFTVSLAFLLHHGKRKTPEKIYTIVARDEGKV